MSHPRLTLILVTLLPLSILSFTGCSTATMAVGPELSASAEPFVVTGANPRTWNRPLSFGPWRTVEVREGLRWGFAAPLLGMEAGFSRQPYRLVLEREDGAVVQAECVTRSITLSRSGWTVDPTFGSLPALACGFRSEATGDEWTLRLHARGTKLTGEIGSPLETPWILRSVHTMEGSRFPNADPVGYEMVSGGSAVGAVEIVNRGRVWISPSLDGMGDARMAAAAAALLIYEPPPD